jgi:peptidoglycan/LPS O-acetylase OafA/YrhL
LLIVSVASGDRLPQRLLSSRLAELAGILSYSIYLVHELLGGLLGWLHRQAETHGLAHAQSYAAVICFLLTFPIAWLAYRFIEAPGRRWLRFVFEKDTRKPPTAQVFESKVEML